MREERRVLEHEADPAPVWRDAGDVRADWPTVPVAIFRFLGRPGEANSGAAMALCVVLMALVAAVALLSERALVRRRPR